MSIVIENLTYTYMKGNPFEKTALNNICLKIEPGEFVGIIGHTGSGKSTLVQLFNGLLKPTQGRVSIHGVDVSGKNLKELRRQVGIVFQYPEHQLFEETVYKDISFGLKKAGVQDEEIKVRVDSALAAVGLNHDILEKSPFELSGGQKRRVAIAGVLVLNPGILVLDEPTAGLDPRGREEIFGYIKRLHQKDKITVILVSHSMEDITEMADRVVVMNNGCIEMDGAMADVFRNSERLEQIGLSVPQISVLMKKLKGVAPQINEDIFTVSEAKNEILRHLKERKKGNQS